MDHRNLPFAANFSHYGSTWENTLGGMYWVLVGTARPGYGSVVRTKTVARGRTGATQQHGNTSSYRHLKCCTFDRVKNTGKTKFSIKTYFLPYPCCPYANDGGIVTFRFSPGHIFIIAMSKPFMTCPTPRTNHLGWPSFCVRLLKRNSAWVTLI